MRAATTTFGLIALGGAFAVFGAAAAAVTARFDEAAPLVLLGLAAVPLVIFAVFADSRAGVAIVFLSFPVGFGAVDVGVFRLQATDAALLAATVLIVLKRGAAGNVPLIWSRQLRWGVALAVWAVLLVSSAANYELAIKQSGSLVAGVVFAALVLTVCESMEDIRRLLGVLVAVAVGIAVPAALTTDYAAYYGGALVVGRPEGVFIEPNELGSFCAMTALVAAGLAFGARTRRGRAAAVAAVALLATGIVVSLSRGAWIGTFMGLGVILITLRGARRAALLVLPLLLYFAFAENGARDNPQVQVVEERVQALTNVDQPYENRFAIWREALRQVQLDPWTGQGPGNFAIASRRHASESLTVYAAHAHNMYLNVSAELGLPGLAALLGLISSLAFAARQALRATPASDAPRDRAVIAGVAAALAALAALGVFHMFVGNAIIDGTIWALVGFLLAAWRLRVVRRRPGSRSD